MSAPSVSVCRGPVAEGLCRTRAVRGTIRASVGVLTLAALLFVVSGAEAAAMPVHSIVLSPAASVVRQLVRSPNYVVSLTDHTARSDTEGLLGLPGQYVAKASFRDANEITGIVEVFATSYDRSRRESSLWSTNQDAIEQNGRVLLRLFNSPSYWQVQAYRQAMANIILP